MSKYIGLGVDPCSHDFCHHEFCLHQVEISVDRVFVCARTWAVTVAPLLHTGVDRTCSLPTVVDIVAIGLLHHFTPS